MWHPAPWSIYLIARAAEHSPTLILFTAGTIIAILAIKKPRHWVLWTITTVVVTWVLWAITTVVITAILAVFQGQFC